MRNGRRNKSRTSTDAPATHGVGGRNVFADLGIPNPEIALAKAELVQRIRAIITERKLTQARAAALVGLDQPKVSALVRGRVDGYSLDRLFRFLNALGQDIEINVRPSGTRKGTDNRRKVLVRY
ncbi:MAG: helix-turn-helix domain-containing protein [Planctomycetaceae bacterium]